MESTRILQSPSRHTQVTATDLLNREAYLLTSPAHPLRLRQTSRRSSDALANAMSYILYSLLLVQMKSRIPYTTSNGCPMNPMNLISTTLATTLMPDPALEEVEFETGWRMPVCA